MNFHPSVFRIFYNMSQDSGSSLFVSVGFRSSVHNLRGRKPKRSSMYNLNRNFSACLDQFESLNLSGKPGSSNSESVQPAEESSFPSRIGNQDGEDEHRNSTFGSASKGSHSGKLPVVESFDGSPGARNYAERKFVSCNASSQEDTSSASCSSHSRFRSLAGSASLKTVHESPAEKAEASPGFEIEDSVHLFEKDVSADAQTPCHSHFIFHRSIQDGTDFTSLENFSSIRTWKPRKKQLSHAILRGIWRWKEGAQVRKKRRKHGGNRDGSSGDGSDPNTDPFTVSASASYGMLSDANAGLTGTSSSGELSLTSRGGRRKEGKRRKSKELTGGELSSGSADFTEEGLFRLMNEVQSGFDSGYGSELGYGGDGELGFDVFSEQENDETEEQDKEGKDCLGSEPLKSPAERKKSSKQKNGSPLKSSSDSARDRGKFCSVGSTSATRLGYGSAVGGIDRKMRNRRSDDVKIWESMMQRLSSDMAAEGMDCGQSHDEDVVSELLTFDDAQIRKLHKRMRRRRRQLSSLDRQAFGGAAPSTKAGQHWEDWFSGGENRSGVKKPETGLSETGTGSGYEEEDFEGEESKEALGAADSPNVGKDAMA